MAGEVYGIEIAKCVSSSIAIFLNCFGIFLLRKYYNKEKSQDFILITLSTVEILIGINWIVSTVLGLYDMLDSVTWTWKVVFSSRFGIYLIWYAIMYMLTLDRFLGCNFPLKHRELEMKADVRIIMVVVWIIGFVLIVVFCVVDTQKVYWFLLEYVWIANDSLYLLLFAITYSSIFCKLRHSRACIVQQDQKDGLQLKHGQQQFLKIITSLIGTFVVLETIPTIIRMALWYANKQQDTVEAVTTMLYTVHISVDPLIYIFLKPKPLEYVHELLCWIRARPMRVYSFRNSDVMPKMEETSFQKGSYAKKDNSLKGMPQVPPSSNISVRVEP